MAGSRLEGNRHVDNHPDDGTALEHRELSPGRDESCSTHSEDSTEDESLAAFPG